MPLWIRFFLIKFLKFINLIEINLLIYALSTVCGFIQCIFKPSLSDSFTNEGDFPAGDWRKKVEAKSICGDIVDRSQSRSLEQLMDQDSINIDNGENQANKRARGILLE